MQYSFKTSFVVPFCEAYKWNKIVERKHVVLSRIRQIKVNLVKVSSSKPIMIVGLLVYFVNSPGKVLFNSDG